MTTKKTTARIAELGLTPLVSNILSVFRSASAEQYTDGATWYTRAHSLALALDPGDPLAAAGVISALSPRVSWNQNQTLAVRAYADGVATGHMGDNCRKANRIMAGEPVFSVLAAPKTYNFALTIADPTTPDAVVVDRHALAISIGRVATDEDFKILKVKGAYDIYAEAYREAAAIAGVAPSVMQAVTWVVWRETKTMFAAANRRDAGRA